MGYVMGFGFWVSGGVVKRNILAQKVRFIFWVNGGGDALIVCGSNYNY
jgi:hypothetical protein